jgi:hypothetical protein
VFERNNRCGAASTLFVDAPAEESPPKRSDGYRIAALVLGTVLCTSLATPLQAQQVCTGDCDGNGVVAVNEIVAAVNIALGLAAPEMCAAVDVDTDGRVTVNEIVVAVGRALGSCAPPPTPVAASGEVGIQIFQSEDSTLYYVIGVNVASGSSGIGAQITSLAISDAETQAFTEPLRLPDTVLTAFAGSGGSLPPLARLRRTAIIGELSSNRIVLDGDARNGEFDPTGRGVLTLPGGATTVSATGGGEPLVAANRSGGAGVTAVPGAVETSLRRRIGATTVRVSAFVFPEPPAEIVTSSGATCDAGSDVPCDPAEPASAVCGGAPCGNPGGEIAGQNVTVDDAVGSRIGLDGGSSARTDGFFLHTDTEVIVFVVDSGAGAAPANGSAAGFLVLGACFGGVDDGKPCSRPADCRFGSLCLDGLAFRTVAGTVGGRGVLERPPVTELGSEFQVNTYTADAFTTLPQLCHDTAGNFVVVWDNHYLDGSGEGVFAQRYDSAGRRRGTEFQVNTRPSSYPAVCCQPSGGFVVAYVSPPRGFGGIFAQRFDSSGLRAGTEFQISANSIEEYEPRVACPEEDGFIAVWTAGDRIRGRLYDDRGQPVAAEFMIGTADEEIFESSPDVCSGGESFVVAWGRAGSEYGAMVGQRFTASGQRLGSEFRIDDPEQGGDSGFVTHDVACPATGGFVVVFSAGTEPSETSLFARVIDAGGDPRSEEILITSDLHEEPTFPNSGASVAVDEVGNFVVVWQGSYDEFGSYNEILAKAISSTGEFRGPEFQVNSYSAGDQSAPAISLDPRGGFLVVWQTTPMSSGGEAIVGRRLRQ